MTNYRTKLPTSFTDTPLQEIYQVMSQADVIFNLPKEDRVRWLDSLSEDERGLLSFSWEFQGRPDQFEPRPASMPRAHRFTPIARRKWRTWLAMAGRGWGKTRVGAQWINQQKDHHGRIALIGETAADVRDVMIEGPSGIMSVAPPWDRPTYLPSKREVHWNNGAVAKTFSGEKPDQLRGPNHEIAWCDELAKFRYADECWAQLQFGLRIGAWPRTLVTTTPRPLPIIKKILKDVDTGRCHLTRGTTYHNATNLSREFFEELTAHYEGTRLGRQELLAELLMDLPGALWPHDLLDKCRMMKTHTEHGRRLYPDMKRVVIAVDPSGTGEDPNDEGDEQGIIAVGHGTDDRFYVLDDHSLRGSPRQWGSAAVFAYNKHKADKIIAEKNYGGDMVRHVIKTVDAKIPFTFVTATRGKVVRAEPVAALYEKGLVTHIGNMAKLEEQLSMFTGQGYQGNDSPDRADALVWGLTELALPTNIAQITSGVRF